MINKFIPFCLLILSISCLSGLAQDRPFPGPPIQLNHITTTEKCRRHFTRTRCIGGEIQKFPFVEITYVSTDKRGKSVEWTKEYSAGVPTTKYGVPIENGGGLQGVLSDLVTNPPSLKSLFKSKGIK